MSFSSAPAELALTVESRVVERLERRALGGGVRSTAVVRLSGGGVDGVGEEVTFQLADLLQAGGSTRCVFSGTLGEFWQRLDRFELFDRAPRFDAVRSYRRWAFEAAALDLALCQCELSLADVLGRGPRPVRFVVSPPPGLVHRPAGARLKIEAVDVRAGLPVDVIDFRGEGDLADVELAAELYPAALLEDPPFVIDGARVSWDVGIRSAGDVERLPQRPAAINVKPARLGSVLALLELYEFCALEGIALYGGGQHELGPGRAQIQLLASLFHPDAPNDVAPGGYNDADSPADLPGSPLSVVPRLGFG